MAEVPKVELSQMRTRIRQLKEETADVKSASPDYVYSPCLVTFFDILGFGEMVRTRSATYVGEILDVLQRSVEPEGPVISTGPRTIGFSDSIVRVVPIRTARPSLTALRDELLTILFAQLTLALEGVFLRGGVSLGDMYAQGSKTFGPGLVRSYELETNFATYPRIVVDPDLIEIVEDNRAAVNLRASIRSLLMRADDGAYFGNYLGLLSELVSGEERTASLLAHKAAIISSLESFQGEPFSRAKLKYTWLARYHNRVCREDDPDECLIRFTDIGLRNFLDPDEDGLEP